MTYVVKCFHPSHADSCFPGFQWSYCFPACRSWLLIPKHRFSRSIYYLLLLERVHEKAERYKTLGLFIIALQVHRKFHLRVAAGVKATVFLVVKGVRPFLCMCSKTICNVQGNNACSDSQHLPLVVILVLTQYLPFVKLHMLKEYLWVLKYPPV